ncbi:MAG: methyltransferase domain-containing protein [Anaerolineae bacterium]|nr:methyltransferase domain-containing protein [Anaerolineae bacterium]
MMNYDELVSEYALHRMVHPEVLRALIVNGFLRPNSRVLDVGCGTGNYIMSISSIVNCSCWGVDLSRKMLEYARQRRHPVKLIQGNIESLHFASNSFDMVFSVDVIHHVQNRTHYINEAYRILKPGGKFCTVTDSEDVIRSRQPLSVYFPELVDIELRRYPSIAALRIWMEYAGFGALQEQFVEFTDNLMDIREYRERAYSALHLLPEEAFRQGVARMEADLQKGPIQRVSRYVLLWGTKVVQ